LQKFKLPKIIGHRGACGLAPENTMASLIKASHLKLSCIEIDVKISRDFIPVLLHDESLERTTSGNGLCFSYSFKELSRLDAGNWFNKKFKGEKILSLSKALDFLYKKNISVNIELKPNKGKEIENIRSVINLINNKKNMPIYYFSSFDQISLEIAYKSINHIPRGLLIDKKNNFSKNDVIDICKKYECFSVGLEDKSLDAETIIFYKKNNLVVTAYTINDSKRAKALFSLGVDSVFTDRPDNLSFKNF